MLELLSPRHAASLIIIDGIGGVGKTALALEVAYRCWHTSIGEKSSPKVPSFDAIIYVSAKQYHLTSNGILPYRDAKRTLRDIIHGIAFTLNQPEITRVAPQEQFACVYRALAQQDTLLIVDNLETMEDRQEIISFLYELPRSVKVIITSRERITFFSPIRLDQLSQEETLNLIKKEAQEKDLEIDDSNSIQLYKHIGGIPAAIVYTIGQIASGYSIETVVEKLSKANNDVTRFCFEGSLESIRGQPAHQLLMAIAIFPRSPFDASIASVAGLEADPISVEEGLALLNKLSLVKRKEGKCTMLPLTREYMLSELATQPFFEKDARRRWVEWYQNFVQEFGGKDWEDWHIRYDRIEEEWDNLLTIFDWCALHGKYDDIRIFWQEKEISKFSHIYGLWDDRLLWLKWLIQAGEERNDWLNVVKAMVDIGSTLTLMGRYEDADSYLQKGWRIRRYVDPLVQVLLLQKIAYLFIFQGDFTQAHSWLDQAQELLESISLEGREYARRWADFYSYRGLVFYKQKDYDQAKPFYQEMSRLAKSVAHLRAVDFAQNHLAHIALAQKRLDEAEELLQTSLPVNRDKRLVAFHNYILAHFHQQKGDFDEARHFAKEALEGFERLGMKQDAQDVSKLLQIIQN